MAGVKVCLPPDNFLKAVVSLVDPYRNLVLATRSRHSVAEVFTLEQALRPIEDSQTTQKRAVESVMGGRY